MSTLGMDHFSIGDEIEFLKNHYVYSGKVIDVKFDRKNLPKKYKINYVYEKQVGDSFYGKKVRCSDIISLKPSKIYEKGFLKQ